MKSAVRVMKLEEKNYKTKCTIYRACPAVEGKRQIHATSRDSDAILT